LALLFYCVIVDCFDILFRVTTILFSKKNASLELIKSSSVPLPGDLLELRWLFHVFLRKFPPFYLLKINRAVIFNDDLDRRSADESEMWSAETP
jgi:hypothetical protein